MELEHMVALVTGAGSGIGKAIALGLAKEGAHVAINDLDIGQAEVVARNIRALGQRSIAIKANVAIHEEVDEMVERVAQEWSRIDILVNNAGIGSSRMVEDMDKAEWDKIMDVNLGGTFNCSRAVVAIMKRQGGGKIINVASIAGKTMSHFGGANYTASKAGVLGFTRHLAFELGPFKINVNAICPGLTVTPLTESDLTPELTESIRSQVPLKELVHPEDIAEAAIFLASTRSRMITGSSIDVDGGMSLGLQDWDDYVRVRKQTH